MALYDNNNLLAILGGQNLNPTTPDQSLQSYAQHGQSLLDTPMPSTVYSPWQAIANALGKFEGRNEIDSAAVTNMDKTYLGNHTMNSPANPNNPANAATGPSAPIAPVNGIMVDPNSGKLMQPQRPPQAQQ